jgi:hypothetical protein
MTNSSTDQKATTATGIIFNQLHLLAIMTILCTEKATVSFQLAPTESVDITRLDWKRETGITNNNVVSTLETAKRATGIETIAAQ